MMKIYDFKRAINLNDFINMESGLGELHSYKQMCTQMEKRDVTTIYKNYKTISLSSHRALITFNSGVHSKSKITLTVSVLVSFKVSWYRQKVTSGCSVKILYELAWNRFAVRLMDTELGDFEERLSVIQWCPRVKTSELAKKGKWTFRKISRSQISKKPYFNFEVSTTEKHYQRCISSTCSTAVDKRCRNILYCPLNKNDDIQTGATHTHKAHKWRTSNTIRQLFCSGRIPIKVLQNELDKWTHGKITTMLLNYRWLRLL